jgi:tetratricopeptide (TPR) repeat protein
VPREFLEDAAACVLYAGNTHLVEPDGTVETITHDVTRLNGRKGIEKVGEYRNIVFTPSYQKLTLNEARIHKADGRVVAVEPRHVQLRDVGTDYQVYDRDKQLIISFPSLEVGDTIEVKWTVRGKNPEYGGHFFTRYSFGDVSYPVVLDELRVRVPRDLPFHFAAVGGRLEPATSAGGACRTYRWEAVNCPKAPQDENLPPREELRPSVVCSTFASWAEVGRWKQRLRAGCWECTPEVRQVVREVTRGLTDPAARARALTYWVRRKIRYVSAGDKHDYTPHPPGQVLANRFGDCKDTSQLLAVMLREAGVHVELATLGVLDDGQVEEAVPSPWGTHAILLATIAGKSHWIDTTATLAGWDFLPRDDRDRLCYAVDDRGRLRLVRTPPLTAADNRIEQTTEVRVGADGSSRCQRLVVSHGSAAVGQRDTFVEVPVGERRRQVTADLQDANSRTRLVRLAVDEAALQDYDRPVTARLTFEVPRQFSGSPDPEAALSDSKVWNKLLAYPLDYDRQVAFEFPSPFESIHRYVVHLPPAYALETLPRAKSVRSPWGLFTLEVKALGGGDAVRDLELVFHTRLEKVRVEPADFEAFRKFHDEVSRDYRPWLTLRPVQELAEAPLLEAALALAPADAATAAVLARLYQQNRHEGEARRVLQRARFYRPDDATLWELSAQLAANKREEEAAQRELVRRFPEEPRYAIDLASTLVGLGRQPEARALLEPLAHKGSAADRARAHFQLARSHYRKDELKQALQDLEEAARADPDVVNTVRAHQLKGRICEELGRPAEAAKAYRAALTVDREAEGALDALIRLALAVNNRAEALDYLRRYTLVVGDDVSGLLLAADCYLRLGRYDDAFDLAWKARDQLFHEKAQRILGLVYLHRGDFAHAVRHLDKAEADGTVVEGLLRAYLALGNLRELAARLEQADKAPQPTAGLRRTADVVRRLLARRAELGKEFPAPPGKESEWAAALDAVACAEHAHAEGRPPAAVEGLLAPAFAGGVEVAPAYSLRGRLALERGHLSAALADAERALALSARDGVGCYVRGRVRLERNAAGALADLARAADLGGRKDAEVLHYLGEALFRAGRVDDALTAQRAAVRLKPKDKDMTEQLARFEKAAGTESTPE